MEERTALLLGEEGVARLRAAHVILFGLGGVGGHVAEALARAGVGQLTLVDADTVAESNLNRQILALRSNLGQPKAQAAAARVRAINPDCRVQPVEMFYLPENADSLPFDGADYVVDAVDTVTAKLEIITRAQAAGVPVISCMGTGNRLHPEMLRLGMLSKTSGCPLARVMRRECRARGLADIPVVYSEEPALTPRPSDADPAPGRRAVVGSVSFVPGAAGLILAGAVVRAIAKA
ncbi:tRNA threonylcarbamoyladenosine dehydratase [Gemmiger formicilis]|uniref:tRNA threonylcarbamoyladenosine dehydratase n=1 Tax=Gemmiger formicilis TaxID=745368 RepID=UPI001957C578|nr:tRNA threonylcarbamoyladenosine dehydratase [Gemmiger formicilis]MBM6916710.1 tRNA threonylcarbamoyladenosine dehydratase [Gemmiger formicilis]HIX33006.1 tRNA threonylcarbamoyladenosine dehydratase [Candidatus Gemmiger avium]